MFRKAQQGPGTVGRGGEAGGPPGGNGLRVTQSPGDMHVTGSSCAGATCWLCTPHAHPSPVTLHRGSRLQGLGTGLLWELWVRAPGVTPGASVHEMAQGQTWGCGQQPHSMQRGRG